MIVVDASALVDSLLRTPTAATVNRWLFLPAQTLHAPHLIDLEVTSVVRRFVAMGTVSQERGHAALGDLAAFPLRRYPHDVLLPRIWKLRHTLTAYDAAYVALAEGLDAPLITRDQRLVRAAPTSVDITLV